MPILSSVFQAQRWLANAHLQTILPVVLLRTSGLNFQRERLELPDGDFLHLDWLRQPQPSRLAILSHGLEGSSRSHYIRSFAQALFKAGWSVLAWNFRGCSGEPNRLLRSYHSGESGDLRQVVAHAADNGWGLHPGDAGISLIGFSLGGNITLKYLGEAPPHPAIRSAVCISVPVDLASSARALDQQPCNAIYLRRFLQTMRRKITTKSQLFPGKLDLGGLSRIRSFREFDDRYTAPMHGFLDADDYWARASSRPLLGNIRVPTLLLSAQDDPFLASECFPIAEANSSEHLFLEVPAHGGHVGFLDFEQWRQPWSERRAIAFFA